MIQRRGFSESPAMRSSEAATGIPSRMRASSTSTTTGWFGDEEGDFLFCSPYGVPGGDRLWVRETCRAEELEYAGWEDGVRYLADNHWRVIENTQGAADAWIKLNIYRGLKGAVVPSIHMPRWASRILLEIVSVRVERLNEISGSDCIAEGIVEVEAPQYIFGLQQAYRDLWESINGVGSWEVNPWVWVIEFKSVKP